ncbi:MAG: phosphate ABC transporter substrate-binding/OmpA family protein [archaeon]
MSSLDKIKGNSKLRVAFTPDSPSHHFGKATVQHFDVPELLPPKGDSRRIETNGSEEAVKKLLAGTADIAIAWEPDVSRALSHKGVIKLLGTEDTTKLIVDILLVPRELARKDPQMVETFLSVYFKVLKHYRDNRDQLKKEIKAETKLSDSAVETMLKGVQWVSLTENCERWFGISAPGSRSDYAILDTIESTIRILINAGDFKQNPLPNKDPARIVYGAFLEKLYTSSVTGFTVAKAGGQGVVNSLETKFPPLSEDGWKKLREIGTLKMDPIIFQQGISELDSMAKEVLDDTAKSLQHYPHFRIMVKGYTAAVGDEAQNAILSQERADSVGRYLNVVYNVDVNRIKVVGFGSSQPLPRLPDETTRAWHYRLARVELTLVREEM